MGRKTRDGISQLPLPDFDYKRSLASITDEKLPTNLTANRHAVHRWFNFVAGFSPEFVEQNCPNQMGAVILDPFAGCGTTLVVARTLGHKGVGFEPHPFFARIARAKTGRLPDLAHLNFIEEILQGGLDCPRPIDTLAPAAGTFLRKLFDEPILEQLLGARNEVQAAGLDSDDTAFLILSKVLEMCSKSKVDGIYKAPQSSKIPAIPTEAIRDIILNMKYDLQHSAHRITSDPASIYSVSSESMREVATATVDAVITSPPYLNNFDFAEMTRMYLYFWEICHSWQQITEKVRSKLLVNTTTALSGHRDRQSKYRSEIVSSLLPELDGIVGQLSIQRQARAGRKDYDKLIFPYFAQMTQILIETQRCMRPNSEAHIVIGDAALYGIHISTPQLLAETMSELGYEDVMCLKLRSRGQRWILKKRDGSPKGLGEYHLYGKRTVQA